MEKKKRKPQKIAPMNEGISRIARGELEPPLGDKRWRILYGREKPE